MKKDQTVARIASTRPVPTPDATAGTVEPDARKFYVTDMGSIIDGEGYVIADEIDEDACELIVSRANLHDELIAALKQCAREYRAFGIVGGETLAQIDAALTKAGH